MEVGPNLTTYENVIAYRNQMIDLIEAGIMPKNGSLSNEELSAFENWADQGYPEF